MDNANQENLAGLKKHAGRRDVKSTVNVSDKATANRILSTLSTIEFLGAAPELSYKIISKAKEERSSVDDLASLILCSPPISASLLKLANSAFYSRGAAFTSVSRAIVHLGLKTVINFIYAIEMMSAFRSGESPPGFSEATFWKSSLAGALLAQSIALKSGMDDAEPVFLCALLRDIGVLVLRQYFPDLFSEAWALSGRTHAGFDQACSETCGIDHRSIAFLLALRWNFPDMVTAVFQPPASGRENFENLSLNRGIVLFSDYQLKTRKMFLWDEHARPDPFVGALAYIPAESIEEMMSGILVEVNEFFHTVK